MAEKAIFGMETLRVTTGYNTGRHTGSYALNIAGKDTGKDNFYAPFTGTVKRIHSEANGLWFESNEPVEWADGTVDYATILLLHANTVPVSLGQVVRQGELLYVEGNKGPYISGSHIQIECGKGKFVGPYGWYNTGIKLSSGEVIWNIYNQVPVHQMLYLKQDCNVMEAGTDGATGKKIVWTRLANETSTNLPQSTFFEVTGTNMQFFNSRDVWDIPSLDGGWLTQGTRYIAYTKVVASDFIWYKFRHPSDGNLYWTAIISDRCKEYTVNYEPISNKSISVINETNLYSDIDPYGDYEAIQHNQSLVVNAVTTDSLYGEKWYRCSFGSTARFVKVSDDVKLIDAPSGMVACDENTIITITGDNCQFFNSMDVWDIASTPKHPDGFLTRGENYYATFTTTEDVGGFKWYIITVEGASYYVAYVADRMTVGTGEAGGSTGEGDSDKPSYPTGDYTTNEKGIDVSKYQYTIDWGKVRGDSQNIRFSFMRCVSSNNSGLYVDGTFFANMNGAKANNIARGAYIFTYAMSKSEIDREVDLALAQFSGLGMEYPVAWDMEAQKFYTNGSTSSEIKANNTTLALYAMDRIKQAGYYPIFYTFTSFLHSYVNYSQIEGAGYKIWVADYRGYCGYKGTTAIWQYSSSGTVSGVNGRCDMDTSYFAFDRYIKDGNWNGFSGGSGGLPSGDTIMGYPYTKIDGKMIHNLKGNSQYFGAPSVYDSVYGYLTVDQNYPILGKLNTNYEDFEWYVCTVDNLTRFIPYLSERMEIIDAIEEEFNVPYDHEVCDENEKIEITGSLEKFSAPNVESSAGFWTKDHVYRLYAILDSKYDYSGSHFGAAVDNNQIFYVLLNDRQIQYNGSAYQRTKLDPIKYAYATDAGDSYYKLPTAYAETAAGKLELDRLYELRSKMNREYIMPDGSSYGEWYETIIDNSVYYIPDTATIKVRALEFASTPFQKYINYRANDALTAYALPEKSSQEISIPSGTLFTTGNDLNDQYDGVNWISVTSPVQSYTGTIFIPHSEKLERIVVFNTETVEPCFYAIPVNENINIYDMPTDGGASSTQNSNIKITSKITERLFDSEWYTCTISGQTKYIKNDSSNVRFDYIYTTEKVADGIAFKITGDDFYSYDRPNKSSSSTPISKETICKVTSIVTNIELSGTWYILENGKYIEVSNGAELIRVYDETPEEGKMAYILLEDGYSAYIYAELTSATTLLPFNTTYPIKARLTANGNDWYRIEKESATYYIPILDDGGYDVRSEAELESVLLGTYLKITGTVFAYENPSKLSTSKSLDVGTQHKVLGITKYEFETTQWYAISIADKTYYVAKRDPGYEVILYYPSHTLNEGHYFVSSTELKVYSNPVDMIVIESLPAGKYFIETKLDELYKNLEWYTIKSDEHIYYVPFYSDTNSIMYRLPSIENMGQYQEIIDSFTMTISDANAELNRLIEESDSSLFDLILLYKQKIQELTLRIDALNKRIDNLTVGTYILGKVEDPSEL